MTFQEWQQALNDTLAELESLKARARREWDLGDDLVLRITASVPGVYVEILTKDSNGELSPVSDVVNRLTNEQAKRVYVCRTAFEDWHAGKSDALLDEPPEASVKRAYVVDTKVLG